MKRWYKVVSAIGALIVLILMFVWLTGNLSREGKISPGKVAVEEKRAQALKTFEVSMSTIPVEAEAVGTVTAHETAEVSSRIMAAVAKVAADAGDTISRGQMLFELDSRDAEARVAQARESLAAAEAALEQAALDAGRIERLYEKQAATKQEYDRTQSGLKMAKASVEAAKAVVREAEVNLSHTRIDSPIAGKVIDRLVDPGDMASPGRPLMSIYNPSTLRLEVSVGERLRPNVHVGDSVKASLRHDGNAFEAEVKEIVPASDPASRSFIVRVSIPEAETAYPGMFGRIWLPTGSAEAVLIPLEALQNVGQLKMVTVVQDGIARTRSVEIGKTYDDKVEILSGLVPGESVVLP